MYILRSKKKAPCTIQLLSSPTNTGQVFPFKVSSLHGFCLLTDILETFCQPPPVIELLVKIFHRYLMKMMLLKCWERNLPYLTILFIFPFSCNCTGGFSSGPFLYFPGFFGSKPKLFSLLKKDMQLVRV